MKKIIMTAIAVIAAATLSSCMGTGTGTKNTVDPAVKANEAYAMDAAKAEGLYALESMDNLGETGKDDYETNTILLGADGTYEFNVEIGERSESVTGKYTISSGGVISFEDGNFAIVANGETVVCDGKKLTAEGKLGRMSTITMNYARVTEEKTEESEEK